MFPISAASLSAPGSAAPLAAATTAATGVLAPVAVNDATPAPDGVAGVAADSAAPASATVDLSPAAQFLSTVSQSQQQLNQLQTAVANGRAPANPAEQQSSDTAHAAAILNGAAQNLVDAFNLLSPAALREAPDTTQNTVLLNSLVQNLQQQNGGDGSAADQLARIGITLQPPLLGDAAGGLSLDPEILRAASTSRQLDTVHVLQQTITTFDQLGKQFAEQISSTASYPATAAEGAERQAAAVQPPQSQSDIAANTRLDLARAEFDTLRQNPPAETHADRLGAQQAGYAANSSNAQALSVTPGERSQGAAGDSGGDPAIAANGNALQSAQQGGSVLRSGAASLAAATAASSAATLQATAAQQAAAGLAAASVNGTSQDQQAAARLNALTQVTTANDAAAAAAAQAAAAQNAVAELAAANAAAANALAQARAASDAADNAHALAQLTAAAQQAAGNLAAANAAAGTALIQARAAQNAATQAVALQAIAAYRIGDPSLGNAGGGRIAHAAPSAAGLRPVQSVQSVTPISAIGDGSQRAP